MVAKIANRYKKNWADSNAGFTLIEFLVVIAISSIVMALIVNMYIRLNKSYMAEKVVADTQQELRHTMEQMMLDIRF